MSEDNKLELGELPELTSKQQLFVEGMSKGLGVIAAYRAAYDCSGMKDTTIWSNASRMKKHNKITPWLAELRRKTLTDTSYTIEEHMRELDEAARMAIQAGNVSALNNILANKGKVAGHYVDQVKDVTPQDIDLRTLLIQQYGEEQGQAMFDELGYEETKH